MINLKEFIKEFIIEHTDNDDDYIGNSADTISFKKENKLYTLSWWDNEAYAFIYSTKLNDFLISGQSLTHDDILYGCLWDHTYYEKEKKKLNNILKNFDNLLHIRDKQYGIDSLRRDNDEDYDEWLEKNQDVDNRFKLGRFWIHNDILYISWWNELISVEFNKYNKLLINYIKDKMHKKFDQTYCMQNDGKLVEFDKKQDNKNNVKASLKRKEILKIQRAIHLATQKEKKEFFKEFKRKRDENNQKKYYNHTKSKTEAEWRSIKYQGDSLIDTIKNILTERLILNKDTKIVSLTNEELQNLYDVLEDFYNYAYSDLFEKQSDRDEAMKCWKNRKPYGIFGGTYNGHKVKTFEEEFYNILSFIIDYADNYGGNGLMKSLRDADKIMTCEQIEDIKNYFIDLI